jgi:hypothetical protein
VLGRYVIHTQNTAQRWFKFDNVGPSPHRRAALGMASDGTHVFILGGYTGGKGEDDLSLIHVFDTSMYFFLSSHLDSS